MLLRSIRIYLKLQQLSLAIEAQSGEALHFVLRRGLFVGLKRNSNRMLTLLPFIRLSLFFYHDEFNTT